MMEYRQVGTSDSLSNAIIWLRSILLGSTASTVTVLAVATIGLLMLSGRVPMRRGATVIIGCFIVFSAATISDGLLGSGNGTRTGIALIAPSPAYIPTEPHATSADPYAGSSVPTQR